MYSVECIVTYLLREVLHEYAALVGNSLGAGFAAGDLAKYSILYVVIVQPHWRTMV